MLDTQTEEQAILAMEKTVKKNKIKDMDELKILPFNKKIKTDSDVLLPVIDHRLINDGDIVNRETFNENNRITCYDNEKVSTMDFPNKKLIEKLYHKDVFSEVINQYLKSRDR